LYCVANLALVAGLTLPYAFHPVGAPGKDWMEGVRGLLMGVSIGMNLMLVGSRRSGPENRVGEL
jgi:hypothetical protein